MTDISITTDAPSATTTSAPIKPGWQTTEFWFSTAAVALTALFASGALTNSVALAIAGMAATVLTALGYKVSRTMIKVAGALLLVLVIGGAALTTACSGTAGQRTSAGVGAGLGCERPSIAAAARELYDWGVAKLQAAIVHGHADAAKLRAAMAAILDPAPRCAFEAAVAAAAKPPESAERSLLPAVDGDELRALYASAKVDLGWPASKAVR